MRYIINKKIGSGGMADIFLADARGPDGFERPVVLKRIRPELAASPLHLKLFIDEANLSARLCHPNTVRVYEFGKMSGAHFLAMEWIAGRDLKWIMAHLQRRDAMPIPAIAAEIVRQACLGLEYVHTLAAPDGTSLNIIHRDVTPSNVMVGVDGTVKLLDFGVARSVDAARRSQTEAGVLKGKLSYLSPEQLQRREIDRRSDLFSLGIVLHELLTWNRLFLGDTDLETIRLVIEHPIPLPSSKNRAVGAVLDRIVMKALERDPERRYQTAAEMSDDLERFLVRSHYPASEMRRLMRERFEDLGIDRIDRTRRDPPAARTGGATLDAASLILEDWTRGAEAASPPTGMRGRSVVRKMANGAALAGALLAVVAVVFVVQRARPSVAAGIVRTEVSISIDSAPQGAQVTTPAGATLGATPVVVGVTRGHGRVEYLVRRDGFEPSTIYVIPDQDKPALAILKPAARPPAVAAARRPLEPVKKFAQARAMLESFPAR